MAIANGCFIGTLFAYGGIYWVGEAMGNINYVALSTTPRKVGEAIEVAAANAAHFAALLKAETIGE